jgi:hypothetical protein
VRHGKEDNYGFADQHPKGLIPIATNIDWNTIRAEYIGGGTSYRTLAEKYGLSKDAIARKAQRQGWDKDRDKARDAVATKSIQKAAEAAADNATIAQDLRRAILLRLQRIEARYPFDATEVRTREGKNTVVFRIRDLTAAYKDMTEGLMVNGQGENELLRSLMEIERRAGL